MEDYDDNDDDLGWLRTLLSEKWKRKDWFLLEIKEKIVKKKIVLCVRKHPPPLPNWIYFSLENVSSNKSHLFPCSINHTQGRKKGWGGFSDHFYDLCKRLDGRNNKTAIITFKIFNLLSQKTVDIGSNGLWY